MQSRFLPDDALWRAPADGPSRGICWFADTLVRCVQKCPVARLEAYSSAWWADRSPREAERRDKTLASASRRNSATGPERKAAGPWGCERCPCLAGCHARLQSAGDQSAADTVKDEATKGGSTPTAFAGSDGALGDVRLQAVRRLSTQVVRNTGERLIVDNRARCMRSRRQRFPTVRMHDQIGNSEARAKMANIRACTSTAVRKRANLLEIHYVCL